MSKLIWSQEVVHLREQLLVQQQWLPTIPLFKVSQTLAFGDFFTQCSKTTKSATITQALNEVMVDQQLDHIGYDGYDAESIRHANDDLTRVIYGAPFFLFLEFLRSPNKLMTFKKIISCCVDDDENY